MPRNVKRALRLVAWSLGLALVAFAGVRLAGSGVMDRRPAYLDLPHARAERVDLRPVYHTGGSIDTAKKTLVECELEAYFSPTTRAGGTATILDLVEDGTMVKKGQVLARLDSSDYEEMVRQHEILLLQAQADAQKARLDLESAEIALKEYRDGSLPQIREYYQGQIVLHEADIRRQNGRLEWARKMVANGYLSPGQVLGEQASLERSQVNLANVRGELKTLDGHTAAVQIMRLESVVENQQRERDFQAIRLRRREEQLGKFRGQVEACTIRAPHAGMAIYASAYNPNLRIEAGQTVFHHMNLFYLPDLGQAEVKIEVNESMIQRIRQGQPALVRVDGEVERTLEGHVKSVAPLPSEPKQWWISREVRNFSATIAIHSPLSGLLPGRTVGVEIQGDIRPGALVVPATAVANEDGRDVVYVVGRGGLSRQVVQVVPGDTRRVEVRSGLAEGEEVIIDPSGLDPAEALAAEAPSLSPG